MELLVIPKLILILVCLSKAEDGVGNLSLLLLLYIFTSSARQLSKENGGPTLEENKIKDQHEESAASQFPICCHNTHFVHRNVLYHVSCVNAIEAERWSIQPILLEDENFMSDTEGESAYESDFDA